MDVFKTRPYIMEKIPISRDNFEKYTKNQENYILKKQHFAICPECDNPIMLVNLYKDSKEENVRIVKPYGRHYPHDIEKLTNYNHENYLNCPYSNPSDHRRITVRDLNNRTGNAILQSLIENYDKIIFLLSIKIGIFISNSFAKQLLINFIAEEKWRYYSTNYSNLPFVLLNGDVAFSIFNRYIRKDSELLEVLKVYPNIELKKGKNGFQILEKAKKYERLNARLVNIRTEVNNNKLYQLADFIVYYEGRDIYNKTLSLDDKSLEISFKRNTELLDMAKELLK